MLKNVKGFIYWLKPTNIGMNSGKQIHYILCLSAGAFQNGYLEISNNDIFDLFDNVLTRFAFNRNFLTCLLFVGGNKKEKAHYDMITWIKYLFIKLEVFLNTDEFLS